MVTDVDVLPHIHPSSNQTSMATSSMAISDNRENHRGHWQVRRGNSRAGAGGRSIGNSPANADLSAVPQALICHSNSVLGTAAWGHTMSGLELSPRSFEALHLERTYLVDSLQQQNHNVTQLLRIKGRLEETLSQDSLHFTRRKNKKHIGWLKCQLEETTQQEHAILARLGQVTYEIQSREGWTQIEHERRQQDMLQQERFFSYQQGLRHGIQQMQRMQLNPAQQECQLPEWFSPLYQAPQTEWLEWPGWQRQGIVGQLDVTDLTYASQSAACSPNCGEATPRKAEEGDCFLAGANSLYKSTASQRSASMDSVELRLLSTNTVNTLIPVHKRHSFPSLPGHSEIWQPTATEQEEVEALGEEREGGEYLGFYVNQSAQVGGVQGRLDNA
ncbi:hypothetical protein JHW43_004018 [Diplocarpon mali]|nr:hypothetical protein JHW43_004018 [Diplocarpon mali]